MAVIDISMDMPKSCFECEKKSTCNFGLWNGWIDDKRDDDCPLKSTDEMLSVIANHRLTDDELIDLDEDSILWGMKVAYDLVDEYCKGDYK